ncbi:DUF4254 domain-containing protein [Nocardia altamirensis]|uniref:DUF4254 domain-containing protein n=1 Tax=Nocardia altamirensis TaxID=472158 RepID=UPI0008402F5A|nr:DUF4254 domain-containing protein [Nocardia altamirensis]
MFVRDRGHRPSRGGARPLPDQRELVAAFGGQSGDPVADHPLIDWARTLATLHRQRHRDPLGAAGIDCRRAELVAAIDAWVATKLPRRRCTEHLRARSLGATVDRMAAAHVHASHLLHTAEKVSDDRVHAAWYRLASLADEWTDLIVDV